MRFRFARALVFVSVALSMPSALLAAQHEVGQDRDPLERLLYRYELVHWDLPGLAVSALESGRLTVQLEDGDSELILEPNNLRALGFRRVTLTAEGPVIERPAPVRTYRGVVDGVPDSDVRLLLTPELASGYVRKGERWHFVEPARLFAPDAPPGRVVLFTDLDVRPEAAGEVDLPGVAWHPDALPPASAAGSTGPQVPAVGPSRILEVATEADGEFTVANGGTPEAANDIIEGFVNQLDGIYGSNLDLAVRLTGQIAATGPAADPYNGTRFGHGPLRFGPFHPSQQPCVPNAGPGLWEQFRDTWNADPTRREVRRDVAVLFTGRDLRLCAISSDPEAELFGTAGDNSTICGKPDRGYAIMERYPINTAGLMAHEVGHSLGAQHDSTGCNGTSSDWIMCGTVRAGSSAFSSASRTAIDTNLASNGACVRPPDIALPVAAGATYYFSDPTPPNVARLEDVLIRNVGGTDLNILNPSALLGSSACIQQITSAPAVIPPGGSGSFRVRLLCGFTGVHRVNVSIQSDSPGESPYAFVLEGQVQPGFAYDVRLAATFAPALGSPRASFESRQAHPATFVSYYYDPNRGSFEQRPNGICGNGTDNPTYFKLSLRGNAWISGCRFQASWDAQELECPPSAVDALNEGREIVINTDDALTDLGTCQLQQPLVHHVRYGQPHSMRVVFSVGGGSYVRRVDFARTSEVTYSELFNDTYVDEALPGFNFGQAPFLEMRNAAGAQKYAIVSAGAAASGTIGSAKLYFDVLGAPINGLMVYQLQSTFGWSEDTLTWSNWVLRTGGDLRFVTSLGWLPANSLAQADVSSVVTGPGAYAFRLATWDGGLYRRLGSGESWWDRPYLVVTTQR